MPFDPKAATDAYLASVPAADTLRSNAYFEGGYWLILWDFLYSSAIALLLLETRLSARLRTIAERLTPNRFLRSIIYWFEYLLTVTALGLPLAIYEGFLRERAYGLMNQTFAAWSLDQAKTLAVALVCGALFFAALIGIVRRLPRTWHLWAAAVSVLAVIVTAVFVPIFISPLFNKFTVLQDPKIEQPILRLARANGIPVSHVYQSDASIQSKRISANVSGMLGTERVTLNDNLLKRCSPASVIAVMGHEMGHYVLHHMEKTIVFLTVIIFMAFFLLRFTLERTLARFGARWGLESIHDTATLPLAVLILGVLGFLATPILNTQTRTQEFEADMYGLNAAREPEGEAEVDLLLGEYRKLDPSPLEEAIFFDHPSGRTRIGAAMRWKAENLNGR